MVTGVNSYSTPSELFVSTFPGLSNIVMVLRVWFSLLVCRRNGCLTTPFLSGCDWSSPVLIHPLRVRAHEVRKVAMSLLFERNCAVHQVLKAETWSAQSTFSSFYLRDVIHRHLDRFSIGPMVAAQQVVQPANPFGSSVVTLHISLSRRLYLHLLNPYILWVVMSRLLLLLSL